MIRVKAGSGAAVLVAVLAAAHAAQSQPTGAQKLTPDEILQHQTTTDQPGSADGGRPIFEKQCASCHRFGAMGKEVGPDLTDINSRLKKKEILEAILWPSRVIADQYKSEMLELKDGKVVTGVLVGENALRVTVRTQEHPDKPVQVPKSQIANRAASTVSLMPEGLLDGYTQADIANLLAFIQAPPPPK